MLARAAWERNIDCKPIKTQRSVHPTILWRRVFNIWESAGVRCWASELIGSPLEMVQYETTTNSRPKQRRMRDIWKREDREFQALVSEKTYEKWSRKKRKRKNGKCCTHSDIKLILFIMHQSNRALLARAYIMQKQVLAFRLLLYFCDIYSDYALFFTVSCRFYFFSSFAYVVDKTQLVKSAFVRIDNSVNDASYFRMSIWERE